MPASRRAPNPSGVHFLAAPHIIGNLVGSFPIGATDLVVDLGAGHGAITAPLSKTGAKIIAVERDAEFVSRLRKRFSDRENVRVVHADVRTVPLPRKEFVVIASIPYAVSTTLFRRLLGPRTAMRRAAMVVEWGFAKRLTTAVPRSPELAWWAARFDIRLARRVPAACFSPAPRVDSAHLVIQRNVGLTGLAERALWTLLHAAYKERSSPARRVIAGRDPHRILRACGIDPAAPAGTVPPDGWRALATRLAEDRSIHWPRLPRRDVMQNARLAPLVSQDAPAKLRRRGGRPLT